MEFFDRVKNSEFSASGKLRLINRFRGGGQCGLPPCDVKGCISQAMALFADGSKKAFCICPTHEGAEEFKAITIPQV